MKTGAIVLSYGLTSYLALCLDSIKWVDRIVVLNCLWPFNDAPKTIDNTAEIVPKTWRNLTLVRQYFNDEHTARNIGMKLMDDMDAVLVLDADEILSRIDAEKALRLVYNRGFSAVMARPIDYWKSCDYAVYPRREHGAIIAVAPDTEFHDGRCAYMPKGSIKVPEIKLHHFGFAITDREMEWKYNTYWNKGDIIKHTHNVVPEWLDKVWNKWSPDIDMRNLGMVTPEEFPQIATINCELPDIVKEYSRSIYGGSQCTLSMI